MTVYFDHEKLNVYKRSIEFINWVEKYLSSINKNSNIYYQLDRAANSISLNIAEGNGKYTAKDKCKFFDISRGSALECASCLDILYVKKLIDIEKLNEGKIILKEIVSMLIGLIKSHSNRIYEDEEGYNT